MIESKFERVEESDPRRCQSSYTNGQCPYKAAEGSSYCPMHGGNRAQEVAQKKIIRGYHLAQWQTRANEFTDHDGVKSLREEIGIARVVLENVITSCKSQGELLLYSGKISDMLMKIEKLVTSCNKLESNLGMLLDKSSALSLATQIVAIISEEVKDENAIDAISNKIARAILNLKPELD
jgi:hypothetical protein